MKHFQIAPVCKDLEAELQHKIDSKTKPIGALGVLEDIALRIGLIQQSLTPSLQKPVIAVFAGDHGITDEEKVSAYPREVTAQMVHNFIEGGAAINVLCNTHGVTPKIIDCGVDADFDTHEKLIDRKIGHGTENYNRRPAMSITQCEQAIEAGAELAEQWSKEGTNVVGFGEMGIGNTSSAAIITSLVTGKPLPECTGKGTGLEEDSLTKKIAVLQQAVQKHSINKDPITILQTFGGFEIAMIVGAILKASEQGMTIIVDGFIVTAAFLVAYALYPEVLDYALFAHQSEERGHQIQLDYLGVNALLKLNLCLGEGTGAAVAYPMLESAVGFLNEMASFEGAGVSKGENG